MRRHARVLFAIAALASFFAFAGSASAAPPTAGMGLVTPYVFDAKVFVDVNPNGLPTTYQLEYRLAGSSDPWTLTPSTPVPVGSGTTTLIIGVTIPPDLEPDTEYEARVTAGNADGSATSSASVFKTAPNLAPDAVTRASSVRTDTTALLLGKVAPRKQQATYWFEYGLTPAYGASVPVGEDGLAGKEREGVNVGQPLTGLQPATTYHYRLIAKNAAGTTVGADQTVTTRPQGAPPALCPNTAMRALQLADNLPGCRAYELVSPADKLGYDVRRATGTIRSSDSGDAVTYNVFGLFGGEAEGTGGTIPRVLSRRVGGEWVTQSVNAPQLSTQIHAGFAGFFFLQQSADFSTDLGKSLVLVWEKGLEPGLDPVIENRWNLYLRDNTTNSYQLVNKVTTGPPPPGTALGILQIPTVEAVTSDLGHIVFQTAQNLTPDASGTFMKTYEWDHGQVRLVGLLPGETPAAAGASPGSGIGGSGASGNYVAGDRDQSHAVSADGSRIFFTALPLTSNGRLYMRENGGRPDARTVWVSESEKTTPDAPKAVRFRDATPDGSKVLFTTAEQLLDEDTDALTDLYLYDVVAGAGGHHLTLVSKDGEPADGSGANVQGTIGLSEDGSRVYFVANGQLVPGASTEAGRKLFLWEGGSISYLHTFGTDTPGSDPNAENYQESRNWNQVQSAVRASMVSADGRYLLFQTYADVTGVPNLGGTCSAGLTVPECSQLYVFDAEAGPDDRFTCASCPIDGGEPADTQTKYSDGLLITGYDRTQVRRLVVDGAGAKVFFDTKGGLVAADVDGEPDVYEYDLAKGQPKLISNGNGPTPSYLLNVSPSGDDVFFGTFDRLVNTDTDQLFDIYDARVGGGIASQMATSPVVCGGETCRGAPSAPPAQQSAGTASFSAPGDPVPQRKAKKQRKGKKQKGRKAKKHGKSKQRGKQRAGNHDRRAHR